MKSAFSLQKGDENVSDPEERGYLLELLEEQNERSQAIIKAEDHRLSKEIKLLDLKCELAHEFDSLKVSFFFSLYLFFRQSYKVTFLLKANFEEMNDQL